MSKINASSDLMKNHKAAEVLPPRARFEAVQTNDGQTMFFSVGDDRVLYLTLEQPGEKTGWKPLDLSSELNSQHGRKKIRAEDFSVTQNPNDGAITVALVVKAEGDDNHHLYVLSNEPNVARTNWLGDAPARSWVARPYDDKDHPLSKLDIAYVYLPPGAQQQDDGTRLVAGVRVGNGNIQNYTVNLSGENAWAIFQTAENFDAILSQCIGKAQTSAFPGLYQLTSIKGELGLNFTPLQSMFGPPTVTKLQAPEGATRLATLPVDDENNTCLFVAARNGLYLFTPAAQDNFASGVKIIDNPIFTGAQSLDAYRSETETVVWGLNQAGQVFHTRCAKGQESDTKAWSYPAPILTGVGQIASFVNREKSNSVIFAHTAGSKLLQMVQDPVTTHWQQRHLVLPSPNPDKMLEYNTYTTHVQLTDANNLPLRNATLAIKATSPCTVYINDTYHVLSPEVATEISPGVTGTVTLVQQTQSLGAVCYHFELKGLNVKESENPMSKLIQTKISEVQGGKDLEKINVTDERGNVKPLLPTDTSPAQKDAAAQSLQQFVKVASSLPADGSNKSDKHQILRSMAARDFVAQPDTLWGVSFNGDEWQYHEGVAAARHFGLQAGPGAGTLALRTDTLALDDIWDAITTTAGDMFNWLKHAYEDVKSFFVKVVDDVTHFFIELGGKIFRFVLNAVSDVMNAVEFIFNKIKVFFEDLVKWLGVIFEWKDILRTHDVLKNLILQYLRHSVQQLGTYEKEVHEAFQKLEERINEWAGLKTMSGSLAEQAGKAGPLEGHNSPQSNWGVYHLQHNAGDSVANVTVSPGTASQLEQLLKTLGTAIENEGVIFQKAFDTLKSQVIDEIGTLPAGEIIKRILAIIADILVGSVENLLVTALRVLAILVEGVIDVLDTPIKIPVISPLYKEVSGNELSMLDAACLVMAIPATVIYKLAAKGQAPFPDNSFTHDLIKAPDWASLQRMFQDEAPQQAVSVGAPQDGPLRAASAGQVISIVMRGVSAVSTLAYIPLTSFKSSTLLGGIPEISVLHGISYFTTVAPTVAASLLRSSTQTWDKILSEAVYGITAVQKLADVFTYKESMAGWAKATKFVDLVLGVAAMVPTCASLTKKRDAHTITAFYASTFWNFNRIISPIAHPETSPELFLGKLGLVGLHGVGQVVLFVEEIVEPT